MSKIFELNLVMQWIDFRIVRILLCSIKYMPRNTKKPVIPVLDINIFPTKKAHLVGWTFTNHWMPVISQI